MLYGVSFCFVVAFVTGVYILGWVSIVRCVSVDATQGSIPLELKFIPWSDGVFGTSSEHMCVLLQDCFVFGIMNVILFTLSSVFALLQARSTKVES